MTQNIVPKRIEIEYIRAMKATDLRIGNWVQSIISDLRLKVTGVVGDRVLYDGDPASGSRPEYDIQGMPITPEWLLKAGFERKSSSPADYNHPTKNIHLYHNNAADGHYECRKDVPSNDEAGHIKTLTHVHKLQNLYYELFDEELEIKEMAQ